jgi:virginiamycin A acetyltransferase
MKNRIFTLLRKIKYHYTKGIAKGWRVRCDSTSMEEYSSLGDLSATRNSTIGRYTSIGRNATIHNSKIGAFCSISWNVTIGATSHPVSHPSTHAFPYISRYQFVSEDRRIVQVTSVGSDVWIGANVIILPGVTIGNGAVIGAGSVVTKNVHSYFIVAGVPAKKIGERFSDGLASKLEDVCWWEWDNLKIKDNIAFFGSPLTEESMSQLK